MPMFWRKATYDELLEDYAHLDAEEQKLRGAAQKLVDAMLAAKSLDTSFEITEALAALQQVLKDDEKKC